MKTSTGFAGGGATAEHIALMRRTVGADTGVKASGGVRGLDTLLEMVDAGADRIGTSASARILDEVAHRVDDRRRLGARRRHAPPTDPR